MFAKVFILAVTLHCLHDMAIRAAGMRTAGEEDGDGRGRSVSEAE